jgi:brefeldin A-inhibited guanine nucleotide-exchange protein 3
MFCVAVSGMKFARRLLVVCWDGILDVLSVLFNGKSTCGITGSLATLLASKEEGRRARDAICTSLDALQRAARLSCSLGLQDRCGAVFGVLANASCVMKEEKKMTGKSSGNKAASSKPKVPRIHAAHALSMDVVLSIGLEMGSHSGDCWKHVLRCCAHVLNLEHTYYSGGHHHGSELAKVQQMSHEPHFDLCMDPLDPDDPEMYTSLMSPTEPITPKISIPSLIRTSSGESGWDSDGGGILNYSQAARVLTGLTQHVDKLFEDVSGKLNMKALVSFLTEMCKVSRQQLSGYGGSDTSPLATNALHLYRLGDILQQILHSELK